MAKLDSDSEETMPITWAVYRKRRNGPAAEPREGSPRMIGRVIPLDVLDKLATIGGSTKRLAARRHSEGT